MKKTLINHRKGKDRVMKNKKNDHICNFNIAGVTFDGRLKNLKHVKYGSKFYLMREKRNRYDENAIKIFVFAEGGKKMLELGYVPRNHAAILAPAMDCGVKFEAKFRRKFVDEKTLQCRGFSLGIYKKN